MYLDEVKRYIPQNFYFEKAFQNIVLKEMEAIAEDYLSRNKPRERFRSFLESKLGKPRIVAKRFVRYIFPVQDASPARYLLTWLGFMIIVLAVVLFIHNSYLAHLPIIVYSSAGFAISIAEILGIYFLIVLPLQKLTSLRYDGHSLIEDSLVTPRRSIDLRNIDNVEVKKSIFNTTHIPDIRLQLKDGSVHNLVHSYNFPFILKILAAHVSEKGDSIPLSPKAEEALRISIIKKLFYVQYGFSRLRLFAIALAFLLNATGLILATRGILWIYDILLLLIPVPIALGSLVFRIPGRNYSYREYLSIGICGIVLFLTCMMLLISRAIGFSIIETYLSMIQLFLIAAVAFMVIAPRIPLRYWFAVVALLFIPIFLLISVHAFRQISRLEIISVIRGDFNTPRIFKVNDWLIVQRAISVGDIDSPGRQHLEIINIHSGRVYRLAHFFENLFLQESIAIIPDKMEVILLEIVQSREQDYFKVWSWNLSSGLLKQIGIVPGSAGLVFACMESSPDGARLLLLESLNDEKEFSLYVLNLADHTIHEYSQNGIRARWYDNKRITYVTMDKDKKSDRFVDIRLMTKDLDDQTTAILYEATAARYFHMSPSLHTSFIWEKPDKTLSAYDYNLLKRCDFTIKDSLGSIEWAHNRPAFINYNPLESFRNDNQTSVTQLTFYRIDTCREAMLLKGKHRLAGAALSPDARRLLLILYNRRTSFDWLFSMECSLIDINSGETILYPHMNLTNILSSNYLGNNFWIDDERILFYWIIPTRQPRIVLASYKIIL